MMTKSNLITQPLAYVFGTVPTSMNADQKKAIAAMIEAIKKARKKEGE